MRAEKLLLAIGAIVLSLGVTSAVAVGIHSIGVLTPSEGGTVESYVYAVSADGTWAVGSSTGANSTNTATLSQAVVWSESSSLVQLPRNAGDESEGTSARGVVVLGNGNLGIAGYVKDGLLTPYRMGSYTVSPTNLAGGSWVLAPGTDNKTIGMYNAARSYTSDPAQWSISGQRSNGGRGIVSLPALNTYTDTGAVSGYSLVCNVASRVMYGSNRAYAAGYQASTTAPNLRRAFFSVTGTSNMVIPGSAGYQSEAIGMSPETTSTAGSGAIVGYDQDTTASHLKHAFVWTMGASAMTLLPELSGGQSWASDVRMIGGQPMVGGSAFVDATENAVMWDNTGLWGGAGQARLVWDALTAKNIDLTGWTSLTRVTSMSDNGWTIGGYGVWQDGTTRGFVATIPEPATLGLLVVGLAAVLRRRP